MSATIKALLSAFAGLASAFFAVATARLHAPPGSVAQLTGILTVGVCIVACLACARLTLCYCAVARFTRGKDDAVTRLARRIGGHRFRAALTSTLATTLVSVPGAWAAEPDSSSAVDIGWGGDYSALLTSPPAPSADPTGIFRVNPDELLGDVSYRDAAGGYYLHPPVPSAGSPLAGPAAAIRTPDLQAPNAPRAAPAPAYMVQPGDTLWDIAATHLGAGASDADILSYVHAIAAANTIENSDLIYPGEHFILPPARE
ncbi:LysM peptidoglycan-binding domain-containing protein [Actinotignum sanguinis]|uniref:LysM domain-containing protein n=2 Tax=Actinomycetaceae TaxID=2049 RepID=A0ABZ0RC69_9ACTO|nr:MULTISPECIES: LysM domain-containing protein [Actinotignum]WPJ89119.1 LysM domain-containing protein [Schaalia turicensis]MDE1552790.1 LysM domain-containing protein [Actinotignum sanguinis]MDE1564723.1 LysM domain-containing protein [Actinotignum sanguinis]MDE1576758.1 LysM domain-containing protein [Actinotignum sanguinis]MDE1642326.1 LysM domain-containing protein [Actinotignum sanguinis]